MIKKVFKHLLTIFIVGLGIINFSSAEYLELNGSLYINGIDVELLPGTNFLSNSQYKVLQTSASYWRHTLFWNNGMLYIITSESYRADINTNIISQGYMKGYCQKDIDPSTASSDTSTCDPSRGNNPSGIYMSEFYNSSQINRNADGLYIEERGQQIRYCFDYYDIGKRNCFRYDVIESQGYFLTGTLNLTSNYSVGTDGFITDTLPYLQNSVFGSSSGGGDGTGSDDGLNDIDLLNYCSNYKAVTFYEDNEYTTNLCYGGYDDFETYTGTLPLYGSGLDVEEIWFELGNMYQGGLTGKAMSFDNWFSYRRRLYHNYKVGLISDNPFDGTPTVLFAYFSAVDLYGGTYSDSSIIDYCNVKLYRIPSNDYNGPFKKQICDLGEGGIELQSNESVVNYFETQYRWDESICYVGVDNVTDLWGSSVAFQEGSGLNIFQAFSGLYGNSDLNKVYVWINNRLINYEQWFYRDSPLYLSNYNSGTNQVDLYYTGLNFPFANNPVAVYFMANNIEDHSMYSTMGSQVVSYCNIKINGGSFDEIIDEADKNNINNYTEQSNKNNGLNPDGTDKKIDYSQFGSFTGDAWISSGVEIIFSGDTSVKNSLKNFFDKLDGIFSSSGGSGNGILPSYIIFGLLFVCLFKLLRKK